MRKAFSPKMLLPKAVHENMDNFNGVTRDLMERLESLRCNNDSVILLNDLIPHLLDWSTECKMKYHNFLSGAYLFMQ